MKARLIGIALVVLGVVVLIWIGTRRRQWPQPPSDLEVAASWLQCIDCYGSFLKRLDELPATNEDTVTQFLRNALLNGADSLTLRRLDRDLEETWEADSLRRVKRGETVRPASQRMAFLERYRRGFGVRWRSRSAIGLGVIGSPSALATLDTALTFTPSTKADSAVYRIVRWARDSAQLAVVTARPAAAEFGRVSGKVVDTLGRPVAEVHMIVEGTSYAVVSDADGQYDLTRVPAGTRTVRARMMGYEPQVESVTVVRGRTTQQSFTLRAAAGRTADSIRTGPGAVSGTVVDTLGRALPGVFVIIEGTSTVAQTDTKGHYILSRVPAGPRSVRTRAVGYQPQVVSVTVVSGRTTQQDFTLRH